MSRNSNMLIAVLWIATIVSSAHSAFEIPLPYFPQEMSWRMTVSILLMPIIFFGMMSIWARHSFFYHPKVALFVNARYGANTLETFLVRLKPLLMFGVGALLQGLVGLWYSRSIGATQGAYVIHGFFVSAGLAVMLAHYVLYFRKAVGVFPTWTMGQSFSQANEGIPERKTLRDALHSYWKNLIGVAIFPAIFFVGGELFHIPFEFFLLPFFGVFFLAGWPYFSGKVPYSFILVEMVVWLAGAVFAVMLLQVLRVVLA